MKFYTSSLGGGRGWVDQGLLESKLSNLFNKHANSLYLDEKAPKCKTRKQLCGKF